MLNVLLINIHAYSHTDIHTQIYRYNVLCTIYVLLVQLLVSGQPYQVAVILELPESPVNMELGVSYILQ